MIQELMDLAIDEVMLSMYEITEFQLGEEPMNIFIREAKNTMGILISVEIASIKKYKGINVSTHPSKDAIMYSIQFKNPNS